MAGNQIMFLTNNANNWWSIGTSNIVPTILGIIVYDLLYSIELLNCTLEGLDSTKKCIS